MNAVPPVEGRMRRFVAACIIALTAPPQASAADCQHDVIRRVTHMSPGSAPYVMASIPVVEIAAGQRLFVMDRTLLDRNPWRAGDKVSLCLDVKWPNFLAVTNHSRPGVLYFRITKD